MNTPSVGGLALATTEVTPNLENKTNMSTVVSEITEIMKTPEMVENLSTVPATEPASKTLVSWEDEAAKAKKLLWESTPKQWLVPEAKLPGPERVNVLGVAEECGILSAEDIVITNTDAIDLVEKMGQGELTAVQVTTAFLKRATIGHQLLNLATEFMVDDAISQAKLLDDYYRTHKKLVGPLHGIPISTKEHISHRGRTVHSSYVCQVSDIAPDDALLVQLLKASGAIFHLRTNEPQTMMTGDTNNNLTGRTLNGRHLKLGNGGSSGGEGASIGYKAAAIGLGTDIGGSIRIPAAFNGVYGLRPTALRMPYNGVVLAGEGQESIRCVIGPLARSINDIELLMKATIDQKPWEIETSLVPLPWRKVESSREITVGIMWNDGIVQVQPPMQRALKTADEKLRAAGIKVVDFEPYKTGECMEIIASLFFPDGGKTQYDLLAASGEPIFDDAAGMLGIGRELTIAENWAYNARRDKLRNEFHALMRSRGVDVILTAPYPGAAPLLGTVDYGSFTMLWNMLDLPALVFPTGLSVDIHLDRQDPNYQPKNESDQNQYDKYKPEDAQGAPICLQVVGKHFCDEETLAAARVIEEIISI